jgi:putative transposase
MPNYRRLKTPGATYFFTVVTYERQTMLCEPVSRQALQNAIEDTRRSYPFYVKAWVLLRDHLHCIRTLPDGDYEFSKRWGIIKSNFTKRIKRVGWALPTKDKPSPSRILHREATIWQRRFWEHQIRDQEDFNQHCDYIHYNPVKHGLVDDPKKWEYSTIHQFINKGLYPANWGDSIAVHVLSMDIE